MPNNRQESWEPLRGRFILLFGAARSGTTWLANILNSSPRTWYSHEPITKLDEPEVISVIDEIKAGKTVSDDGRNRLLWHWSRAYHALARPPFFRKDFVNLPPMVRWYAWLAARGSGHGFGMYRSLFSPSADADFDLVIKQGFSAYTREFVECMKPDAIIAILRHPCAVISSLRRGRKQGLMETATRCHWLEHHVTAAQEMGYTAAAIERMPDAEFESLCWLVESGNYLQAAEEHQQGHVIIYRDLCADPFATSEQLFQAMGWEMARQTREFLAETTGERPPRWMAKLSAGNRYFSVYRPRRDSIDAWRRELSPLDQERIMAVARPLLERCWPDETQVPV